RARVDEAEPAPEARAVEGGLREERLQPGGERDGDADVLVEVHRRRANRGEPGRYTTGPPPPPRCRGKAWRSPRRRTYASLRAGFSPRGGRGSARPNPAAPEAGAPASGAAPRPARGRVSVTARGRGSVSASASSAPSGRRYRPRAGRGTSPPPSPTRRTPPGARRRPDARRRARRPHGRARRTPTAGRPTPRRPRT